MTDIQGKCPGCDADGTLGVGCPEKGCSKRGYHFIPLEYWDAAHEETDSQPDPMIGLVVGDFLIVSKIGAGGFGKVFLALQSPLFRLRGALKLIEFPSENAMLTQALLEKFQGEAEALADLTHPNIVRLLKYGIHKKKPYLVMEFVDQGRTLRQEIQHRAREEATFGHNELQAIFDQILNGLAAAHEQNIIHRDVKPENIMLQSVVGNPLHIRILDFGTAKFVENRADTKWPLGSPSYMAPEQVNLKGIGPWSDLYAVGVMIFELLTGRRPFPGNTENEIVANKLSDEFDPLLALDKFEFPEQVGTFLARALETDPEARFRDAESFRADMTEVFDALSKHPGPFGSQGAELTALIDSSDLIEVIANAQTRKAASPPNLAEQLEESRDESNAEDGLDVPAPIQRHGADETAEIPPGESHQVQPGEKVASKSRRPSILILFVVGVLLAGAFYMVFFSTPDVGVPEEPTESYSVEVQSAIVAASAQIPEATDQARVIAMLDHGLHDAIQSARLEATHHGEALERAARFGLQAVAAGKFHTCALVSGKVRCWGANFEGELGQGHLDAIGDDEPAHKSEWIELGEGATDLAVAGDRQASFSCALLESGALRCWGANSSGQLGLGHTNNLGDDEPVLSAPAIVLDAPARQVAVGAAQFASHVCALLEGGALRCWGGNNYGQLGLGHRKAIGDASSPTSAPPVDLGFDVQNIYAGKYHTCALSAEGRARCWGWNSEGQLGLGHIDDIGDDEVPLVSSDVSVGKSKFVDLSLGRRHTCALDQDQNVRCWGWNSMGQLGLGHTNNIGDDEPVSEGGIVELGEPVVRIGAGENHTCALLESGAVKCWGDNRFGQLGYSHTRPIGDDELPSSVGVVYLGKTAVDIAVGSYHNCAILEDETLRCWGYNKFGQLGYGHTTTIGDSETPASAGDVPLLTTEELKEIELQKDAKK